MAINFSNYRLGQLPYWTNVSLVKGVLEQIFPLTTVPWTNTSTTTKTLAH